jgi:hypothetical protein
MSEPSGTRFSVEIIPGMGWRLSVNELVLEVPSAGIETKNQTIIAVVSVFQNGTLLHRDQVNLTRQRARSAFVETIKQKHPGAEVPEAALLAVEEAIRLVSPGATTSSTRTSDSPSAEATPETGATPRITVVTALYEAIRKIMLDRTTAKIDKPRLVADIVHHACCEGGQLIKSREGGLFYFRTDERRLYDLEGGGFENLLSDLTSLSPTEALFKLVRRLLIVRADRRGQIVAVHTGAYFDPATGFLAVSDGGSGVWMRERTGEWSLAFNGDQGLLFTTDDDADAWVPDFAATPDPGPWFLGQFSLAAHGPLSVDDQETLLWMDFLHDFFPSLRRTRIITGLLGPQGSGKTTALKLLGRVRVGPRFDVTSLSPDGEDDFVAAVTARTVLGIDNADSRVKWLEDGLATYATGTRYRKRKLYTTNDEVSFAPRAKLMISSRDPRFRRPDVAERLLPLQFARPKAYVDEATIFTDLEARRPALWGAILTELGRIADGLATIPPPKLAFRMADFATFGWRVSALRGAEDQWVQLLATLERAQIQFASEGDGLIETLRFVLVKHNGTIPPAAVADLFDECWRIADVRRFAFPKTVQGFGQMLTSRRHVIELELGVRMTETTGQGGVRRVAFGPRTE